jgi:outer membrane murein-binding lipoprotein Lpp
MARVLLAAMLLWAPIAALAADDLKVSQLEADVRDLKRQVQGLSRQLEELRAQLPRAADRPTPAPSTTPAAADSGTWIDASKWKRLRPGMSELEVIGALGPPTSMRIEKGERVLLYALEIGSSGFLGGSVKMRDGLVVEVRKPTLQ